MSNAQVLYLQKRIAEKLSKHGNCLHKIVAHLALQKRLQVFVRDTEDGLSKSEETVDQAMAEEMSLLQVGRDYGTKGFEDRIAWYSTTR